MRIEVYGSIRLLTHKPIKRMTFTRRFRQYRTIILLFISAALILRIPILKVRFFALDEFQHLHGTSQICHRQISYLNYFDYHTPSLHFILNGFYPIFGEIIRIVFGVHTLIMIFTKPILYGLECCGVYTNMI